VFLGSASGIGDGNPSTADAQLESNQAQASLGGSSVSSAGDVNGDGYDDVVVGAAEYSAGEASEGAAFVFLGSASGIADGNPSTAAAQLESDQADALLGFVAPAGDVNRDGYDDLIAGARSYDAGETDEGAAFVFLGSASGIAGRNPSTAAAQLESGQADAFLLGVSSAGDANDDGYDDVAVAWLFDPGSPDEGLASVFLGSASGIASASAAGAGGSFDSDQTAAGLVTVVLVGVGTLTTGRVSVAPAGDVNGDDRADLIVGFPGYNLGLGSDDGAAFVVHGVAGADDDDDGAADTLEAAAPNGGDGNGDGTPDSAQDSVASLPDAGSSYVTIETSGACAELAHVDVNAESGAAAADPSFDYPYGVARFELPCASATVKLFFHGTSSLAAPYRKYGPTTPGAPATAGWYTLGSAVFGSQVVGGDTVATVTLSLSDGALGDATGVDGTIVDPGGPALLVDADLDGVLDATDNCTGSENPSQLDSDADGCGNACDADFDQNGATGATDFNAFRLCFLQSVPGSGPVEDPTCAESDLDGDLVVGGTDFNAFRLEFNTPPGPGAACPF
jgi:hypothetical protein